MKENIYNPEYVKGLFNRMSGSYERMNYITSFGFSIRWRRQLLSHLRSVNKNVEIIDLMAGMGETWKSVKNKFPKSSLTALDFSEEMIKYAQSRNKRQFKNQISIRHEDILNNKLPSDNYDVVICAFGLKTFNAEQLNILASETHRILRKGGQFAFVEISKPRNKGLLILFRFYLRAIIPILGRLLLGDPQEYKMLWKYTENFDSSYNAFKLFEQVGFQVNYYSYFHGCATGFNGMKIK